MSFRIVLGRRDCPSDDGDDDDVVDGQGVSLCDFGMPLTRNKARRQSFSTSVKEPRRDMPFVFPWDTVAVCKASDVVAIDLMLDLNNILELYSLAVFNKPDWLVSYRNLL